MKNTTLFILLSIALCFAACNDDDENLSPTGETNWLVLEDSDDEVDHLAYEIYRDYGIPIYYNDTIARIPVGKKEDGEVVYRYELLGVNYHVSVTTNYQYDLLEDREQIKAGMEFLRDYVMPELLNYMAPRSYLLTNSLQLKGSRETVYFDSYKARKTTCVKWKEMSENDKKAFGASILAVEYAAYLMETESEILTAFYNCSLGTQNGDEVLLYGKELSASNKNSSWDQHWEVFGFLNRNKEKGYTAGARGKWVAPSQLADLEDYAREVLKGDDEAFQEKYEEYPNCLQKYDLMKKMITDLQETLGKRQKK